MKTGNAVITPGWLRALLFVIGLAIAGFVASFVNGFIADSLKITTGTGFSAVFEAFTGYFISALFFVLLTFLFCRFIDRQPFISSGFSLRGYRDEAIIGFFSAVALLGTGSIILVAAGFVSLSWAGTNVPTMLPELAFMAVVAFTEELAVRGYLLKNLMQSMNPWIALAVSAVIFSALHLANPGINGLALFNVFLGGIFLGLNYVFTQNLWFGICFHFAWNYFQGPILGFEVSGLQLHTLLSQSVSGPAFWSGGNFGFEGSTLCALLLSACFVLYLFLFKKRYGSN